MPRRVLFAVIVLAIAAGAAAWYLSNARGPNHYTGFVEGEERILRSEVAGRGGEGAGVERRRAELRQTEAAAELANSTFKREQALVASGASTAQLLDEARSADHQ